jgi:hypothetical protein
MKKDAAARAAILAALERQLKKGDKSLVGNKGCRNVKHWRSPSMAKRGTAAAMVEAKKGFRRLKAHWQLPVLRAALDRQSAGTSTGRPLAQIAEAA